MDPDLRLDDGGPAYVESLPLETLGDRLVAEPWNAATAALFLFLALWWWRRCAREGLRDGLLAWALPVLAIGGVGGALYHGTRAHRAFLLMDAIPIVALVLGVSVVLWRRLLGRWWWAAFFAAIAVLLGVRGAIVASRGALPGNLAALAGYATFATMIIVPALLYLRRTAWSGTWLIGVSVACFAAAIACRTLDPHAGTWLGAGLHALWHVGGLFACHALIAYLVDDARQRQAATCPSSHNSLTAHCE